MATKDDARYKKNWPGKSNSRSLGKMQGEPQTRARIQIGGSHAQSSCFSNRSQAVNTSRSYLQHEKGVQSMCNFGGSGLSANDEDRLPTKTRPDKHVEHVGMLIPGARAHRARGSTNSSVLADVALDFFQQLARTRTAFRSTGICDFCKLAASCKWPAKISTQVRKGSLQLCIGFIGRSRATCMRHDGQRQQWLDMLQSLQSNGRTLRCAPMCPYGSAERRHCACRLTTLSSPRALGVKEMAYATCQKHVDIARTARSSCPVWPGFRLLDAAWERACQSALRSCALLRYGLAFAAAAAARARLSLRPRR
eukprot:gb/GFBE01075335.1/.p1 GENE.gb/GFBE01075335.1/~~gb/GFBE01075335.1/.p1  ORF type:complete len:309 (+),score=25.47 gb/GFBE01075335.1/:1-927(+)